MEPDDVIHFRTLPDGRYILTKGGEERLVAPQKGKPIKVWGILFTSEDSEIVPPCDTEA